MTSEQFDVALTKGIKFICKYVWLEVSRGHFKASDESLLPKVAEGAAELAYETGVAHLEDFIDAVKLRRDPIVPVEIGHRTCTVCTLGNIACELKRTLKWDPVSETFVGDSDGAATKMLHYQYRDGWSLV